MQAIKAVVEAGESLIALGDNLDLILRCFMLIPISANKRSSHILSTLPKYSASVHPACVSSQWSQFVNCSEINGFEAGGDMKKLILSLSVIAVLVISQTASADSRYGRRGYSSYGYGNYYSPRYNRYDYRRASPYYYGYRRGGSYFDFGYGGYYYPRYRRRHYDSGAFVGGLVLGSLLTYPRYSRRYDSVTYTRPVTRTREVVYVKNRTSGGSTPVASGRRLLRDLEGNCFERNVDEDGNEIRIQLDASECNF